MPCILHPSVSYAHLPCIFYLRNLHEIEPKLWTIYRRCLLPSIFQSAASNSPQMLRTTYPNFPLEWPHVWKLYLPSSHEPQRVRPSSGAQTKELAFSFKVLSRLSSNSLYSPRYHNPKYHHIVHLSVTLNPYISYLQNHEELEPEILTR